MSQSTLTENAFAFVIANPANINWKDRYKLLTQFFDRDNVMDVTLPTDFARQVRHDTIDDTMSPVSVYSYFGQFVGWYDSELLQGFAAR